MSNCADTLQFLVRWIARVLDVQWAGVEDQGQLAYDPVSELEELRDGHGTAGLVVVIVDGDAVLVFGDAQYLVTSLLEVASQAVEIGGPGVESERVDP